MLTHRSLSGFKRQFHVVICNLVFVRRLGVWKISSRISSNQPPCKFDIEYHSKSSILSLEYSWRDCKNPWRTPLCELFPHEGRLFVDSCQRTNLPDQTPVTWVYIGHKDDCCAMLVVLSWASCCAAQSLSQSAQRPRQEHQSQRWTTQL